MDMPQPSEKDTTSLMNTYNFINPVSVTVIYEEDEKNVKEINIEDKYVHSNLNEGENKYLMTPSYFRRAAKISTEYEKNTTKLLDKVAQNMSYVVQYYNNIIIYYDTLKLGEKHRFKRKYFAVKYRYFQLSYDIVRLLILPQKTNKVFTQNFVQKIIEMSNVNIHPSFVKYLYDNLILWTEHQILAQHNPGFANVHQVGNTLSWPVDSNKTANPKKNPENIERRSSNQDDLSKQNKVIIFSAGPKGKEIIISAEAKYLDTAAQIDKSSNASNCRNEPKKPEQNIFPSLNTNASSKVNSHLHTETQYNPQTNDISNSMLRSSATDCANPLFSRLGNFNNNHSTMRTYNVGNPLTAEDIFQYPISQSNDVDMSNLLSLNPSPVQMNPAAYLQIPKTVQSAQGNKPIVLTNNSRNNVTSKFRNNSNYPSMRQNEMQNLKQYTYPRVHATSTNIVNPCLSMTLHNNYRKRTSHRTDLHYGMNIVSGLKNQNNEYCNFTNTLPCYSKNYY